MFRKLLIVVLIGLLAEVSLLIFVGSKLGTMYTLLLLLISAALGILMVRRQGLSILYRIRTTLRDRQLPGEALLDGISLLIGGFLLVFPGFLSDGIGLLLLIPFSRERMKRWIKKGLKERIRDGNFTFFYRRRR